MILSYYACGSSTGTAVTVVVTTTFVVTVIV